MANEKAEGTRKTCFESDSSIPRYYTVLQMRIKAGFSAKSEMESGVHHGSAMNPVLFIIVME